jgi:cation diffusion facilitator family transporter
VFDGDPLDKNSPYRKDLPSPKHAIAIRKLSFVASISLVFLVLEVIGGVVSQSLAIFSDAAYRLSDLVIYLIGIVSIYLSRKPAGPKMTFGYSRAEVLGALLSVLIIWVIAFFL